jgi:ketosteroid isomerase-like protein
MQWVGRIVAVALAAGVPCVVMATDRSAELERVVASERAFAARAQVVNARQAFVEYFAPDAIFFAPFAAPAFPRLRESADWGVNIQWRPAAAAISGAGDMGYTTGPAEYRPSADAAPTGFGHYTSVWQRQPDGRFLVVIDVGIDHPAPPARIPDWSPPAQSPAAAPALELAQRRAALEELRSLDAQVGTAAQAGEISKSFARVLSDDARLHLGGRLPALGRAEILADLRTEVGAYGWTPEAAAVAESGDFGFVYGRGRWSRARTAETGDLAYLNVWQRRAGEWRLIVHVSRPVAPRPTQ